MQILRIYFTIAVLVNNLNVLKERLNYCLQLLLRDFEDLSAFEKAERGRHLKYCVYDVNYTLNFDEQCLQIRTSGIKAISVYNLIYDSVRLDEECNLVRCKHVVQEIGIHFAQFSMLGVLNTVPHRD